MSKNIKKTIITLREGLESEGRIREKIWEEDKCRPERSSEPCVTIGYG